MSIARYLGWREKADVGCVFARFMSRRRGQFGQCIEVIKAKKPDAIAQRISARVAHHVAAPESTALTLVLPEVKNLSSLVAVAQALGAFPKWIVKTQKIRRTEKHEACVAFHVTRMIPFGAEERPSEGLFLGPFKAFPRTRRAPVTAFELFVGEPLANDPKTKLPTQKANLAHIVLDLPTQQTFESMWDNSKKGRRHSLDVDVPIDIEEVPPRRDDLRAKAKVAFALPSPLAKKLGLKR